MFGFFKKGAGRTTRHHRGIANDGAPKIMNTSALTPASINQAAAVVQAVAADLDGTSIHASARSEDVDNPIHPARNTMAWS